MGQVLKMADFRPVAPTAKTEEPGYYCTRCESERFLLYPSGEVRCAHCGVVMANLDVRTSLLHRF